MRIALLGNCQVLVIAQAIAKLRPKDEIETFSIGALSQDRLADAVKRLPQFDRVFAHYIHDQTSPASGAVLRQFMPGVEFIPMVSFTGLHPDFITIPGLTSPLGAGIGHSRIAAAAWLAGMPQRRAVGLFNAFIYARLGYFEHYQQAKTLLLRSARNVGYDLGSLMRQWETMGRWVYVPHHPSSQALTMLAQHIAVKSGLAAPEADKVDPPDEDIMGVAGQIWPVYPEIASRIGLGEGELIFRLGKKFGQPGLDLNRFIEKSYQVYADADPLVLNRAARSAKDIIASLLVG